MIRQLLVGEVPDGPAHKSSEEFPCHSAKLLAGRNRSAGRLDFLLSGPEERLRLLNEVGRKYLAKAQFRHPGEYGWLPALSQLPLDCACYLLHESQARRERWVGQADARQFSGEFIASCCRGEAHEEPEAVVDLLVPFEGSELLLRCFGSGLRDLAGIDLRSLKLDKKARPRFGLR